MKTATILLAVAVLSLGCAGRSDIRKVADARQIYTTTLESLSDVREAGVMSDEIYDRIEAVRVKIPPELDAAEEAALSGRKLDFTFAMDRMNKYLNQLLREQALAARRARNNPQTP